MSRIRFFGSVVLGLGAPALAVSSASQVISYTHGTANAVWQSPQAAIGLPDGLTGENPAASNYFGFPNILSPFSPAYQGDEIVQIGEGGQLTLQLSHYATIAGAKQLGVFSNVGLIDDSYPSGQNGAAAGVFGGGAAQVRVSDNGSTWVDLGTVQFNRPTLHYVNGGAYDTAAPASPQLADFGLPFTAALAEFDGKAFAQTVEAFKVGGAYSAGGTWIDLSSAGLAQVGYVQFLIADDGNPLTDLRLSIDAVTVANAAVGAEVPEPAGAVLVLGAMLVLRRRK